MRFLRLIAIFHFMLLISVSCKKSEDPGNEETAGKVIFKFDHFVEGSEIEFDDMKYVNAAGNQYEVTEIQWFVSDITLDKSDGSELVLNGEKFAHYVDTNMPETSTWEVSDQIPLGLYSSISMTFGIKGEKNTPFSFTDPPESDMLWPINLGGDQGGYHYMKLNGFWINKDQQREPFNFHLGVGQERDSDNNVTGFIQNWFEVELPESSFTINQNTMTIAIRMNVEKWWEHPYVYNHDEVGGKIMQNQTAMKMGVENGKSVFSLGSINELIVD